MLLYIEKDALLPGDYEENDLRKLAKQILPPVSPKAGSFATSLSEEAASLSSRFRFLFFLLLLSLIPVVSILVSPQTMSLEDNSLVKNNSSIQIIHLSCLLEGEIVKNENKTKIAKQKKKIQNKTKNKPKPTPTP